MGQETADIVIIGGGVIGVSIAYYLAKKRCSNVVILEKEKFLGTGSTGACAGGIRQQFSTKINIALGMASVQLYEDLENELNCSIDFRQNGYLFLLTSPNNWEAFQNNVKLQHEMGLSSVKTLTTAEAKEIVPFLNIEDVVGATFCPTDAIADPNSVVQGYAKEAKRLGVRIFTERPVVGIKFKQDHKFKRDQIIGVLTSSGDIDAPIVINAAGPYAREIGKMIGVEIPVSPVRRQIFVTAPFSEIPVTMPMVVDFETTLYMHPESGGILMGMSDESEPVSYNTNPDQDFMLKAIERAIHRMPILEKAQILRGWGGLYEITPDYHPILGQIPGVTGLYCAVGFSGHGFMHAPITGKLLAELIIDGKTSIDISPLSLTRFAEGRSIRELNVI